MEEGRMDHADRKPLPKISEEVVTKIKAWGWSAVSDEGALRMTRPHAPKDRCYAAKKPLPKISEEVVTKIKAWGSVFRRWERSSTAWWMDSTVSTTYSSWWV